MTTFRRFQHDQTEHTDETSTSLKNESDNEKNGYAIKSVADKIKSRTYTDEFGEGHGYPTMNEIKESIRKHITRSFHSTHSSNSKTAPKTLNGEDIIDDRTQLSAAEEKTRMIQQDEEKKAAFQSEMDRQKEDLGMATYPTGTTSNLVETSEERAEDEHKRQSGGGHGPVY